MSKEKVEADEMTMMEALSFFYGALDRQGPGDDDFARKLLGRLPDLPANPKIADLGCGTGWSSLLLADHFKSTIHCVDLFDDFIEKLNINADASGLSSLINAKAGDMAELGTDYHDLDLLWSEGAAYNLTFAGALKAWRPLIKTGGLAVISEMVWFGTDKPAEARRFWEANYPTMGSQTGNLDHVSEHGFEALFLEPLPSKAWWDNYYGPLMSRLEILDDHPSSMLQNIMEENRQEIDLFKRHSDHMGYCYYVLKAV